ncbi:MAG: thioredoxin-disulfide reductase [bacterium]|nr:thioredoxin-disulfide reductase [bacterium]
MSEKSHYNVLVIGSGPAGSTAAIYTSRADLETLVLEGRQPGGQLTITTEVENFPGFEKGVMGPELVAEMKKQAERFGAKYVWDFVTDVDVSKRPFTVTCEENTFTCDALIIASGATARTLGLPNEKRMMGFGVSACATCDGFFFKEKEIVIVGGGDSAMEEAVYLTKFASKVTIIHRREELRASKIMQDRAKNTEKIEFVWNNVVEDILGTQEEGVTGLKLKNTKTGEESEFKTQGLFFAIGHVPNTEVFKGKLEMDDTGYIITKPDSTATGVAGIFAAGDVQDSVFRQAITAAGTGCMAAIEAERFLES